MVELGSESLHLLVGGALVLVHDGTEGTTGTGIIGVVLVGEVLDALEVLVDLLVDASLELLLGLATVLGHASDGSTELLLGLLLGDFHLGLEELEGGLLLLGVLGGELRHGLGGAGLLGLDLTLGLGSEGIDVGTGLLGLLDHAVGVGVETGVGLLDLLLGLLLEGGHGAGSGGHGILELVGDSRGVGSDGVSEGLAVEGGSGVGLGSLGLLGGGLDGVDHLLLELLASRGVGEGELLDGGGGLLAEVVDLSLELVLSEPAHVSVHLVAVLLDELGASLALLDGVSDGGLELLLVGLLESTELTATLAGLLGVLIDDAGEVLDLLVSLGVVRSHHSSEVVNLTLELLLGLADGVEGIELLAADVSLHLHVAGLLA